MDLFPFLTVSKTTMTTGPVLQPVCKYTFHISPNIHERVLFKGISILTYAKTTYLPFKYPLSSFTLFFKDRLA
jgi:hypothetical protein